MLLPFSSFKVLFKNLPTSLDLNIWVSSSIVNSYFSSHASSVSLMMDRSKSCCSSYISLLKLLLLLIIILFSLLNMVSSFSVMLFLNPEMLLLLKSWLFLCCVWISCNFCDFESSQYWSHWWKMCMVLCITVCISCSSNIDSLFVNTI
jgi:hypothetical protein